MKHRKQDDLILIGVIYSAHGVRGDVIVKSFTDPFENIVKMKLFDKNHQLINAKKVRVVKNNSVVFKIEGCDERNKAEDLKGFEIFCQRADLPPLKEQDQFYVSDLKGRVVCDIDKNEIGVVHDIANYGAGDIVEIKFSDGEMKMLPFQKDVFPVVDKDIIIVKLK
ncbi:MAG: hypothetical protein DGJ47_000928 [Rickettsiaceae bacterium]